MNHQAGTEGINSMQVRGESAIMARNRGAVLLGVPGHAAGLKHISNLQRENTTLNIDSNNSIN